MVKYKDIENMGEVFAQELWDSIEDTNIKSNEILYKKITKKLSEAYNSGITEAQCELKDAMDAISALKCK
jgi:predicted XRE-type DNA-binding protein